MARRRLDAAPSAPYSRHLSQRPISSMPMLRTAVDFPPACAGLRQRTGGCRVGAVIVASLLRGFVGQMFLIPSISMQSTLQVDDRVVVGSLRPSGEK